MGWFFSLVSLLSIICLVCERIGYAKDKQNQYDAECAHAARQYDQLILARKQLEKLRDELAKERTSNTEHMLKLFNLQTESIEALRALNTALAA